MKKTAIATIAVLLILSACATTPKGADELDIAIREASDYLNGNIPKGNKIVIINIQSGYDALSEYIIDELIANAVNDKIFSVVDRAQLEAIRTELNFQLSGEVNDDSALSIGKFLGAQSIVTGSLGELGNRYRITVRALNVATAEVQGQFNRNITTSQTITALMKGTRSQGTSYAGTTASGQTQTTTAATAPKNGTYYFYPRIRCYRVGVLGNQYLDRIVVRGEHFTVYTTNAEIGTGNPYMGGNFVWGSSANNVLLQNLDIPRLTWKLTNWGEDETIGGAYMTFQGVTGKRFKLLNSWYNDEFEEIILGEPDE